jgi:hypothetical protein
MTDKELLDDLMKIKASQFDLWKYFEDRADQFGERLWTIGIWLMAVIGATLSLPFAAKFVTVTEGAFPIHVVARLPVAVISVFGMAFVVYAFFALLDIRHHIVGNWERAVYARTLEPERQPLGSRKLHGWWVLLVFGCTAAVAFAGLFILACVAPDATQSPL